MLAEAPRSEDPFGPFLEGAGFTFLAPHQKDLVDALAADLALGSAVA